MFLDPKAIRQISKQGSLSLNPCDAYRREWEPQAIEQEQNLDTCHPRMRYYNAPCTRQTMECLLFTKDKYERRRADLRELVRESPSTGKQRLSWCQRAVSLIDQALDATNIRGPFLLGGPVPVDYDELQTQTPTLPASIWPNANAFLSRLSREAVDQRTPAMIFPPQTYGWGPMATVHTYHDWRDYAVSLEGAARPRASGSGGSARVVGTRGLGLSPAPKWRGMEALPLPRDVRRRVMDEGVPRERDRPNAGDLRKILETYFEMHNAGASKIGYFKPRPADRSAGQLLSELGAPARRLRVGGEIEEGWFRVSVPSAQQWEDYYRAIIADLLATPYEVWVLYGIEQWSLNMETWASRGRLALPPDQFRDTAVAASRARQAAIAGAGFSVGTSLLAATNPVAGALAVAASQAITILLGEAGAVGGWYCPTPLTLRSASGDCDFTKLLGDEEGRWRERAGDVSSYFGPDLSQETEPSTSVTPYILGGVAVLGVAGIAYYFWRS